MGFCHLLFTFFYGITEIMILGIECRAPFLGVRLIAETLGLGSFVFIFIFGILTHSEIFFRTCQKWFPIINPSEIPTCSFQT